MNQQGIRMNGNQRTEELNNRLSYRNLPSHNLQPQFGIRPLSTKYALMPVLDRRPKENIQIDQKPAYNIHTTFNPGTAQAPWSGFATNVNIESSLRNQFFALQRGGNQACYIPEKNSDMYESKINATQNLEQNQPFPSLFVKEQFQNFNPCPSDNGTQIFSNFTRYQIKEIK